MSDKKPFPVAENFFAPVRLSPKRLEELRAEAKSALDKTLTECHAYQRARGKYLGNVPAWKLHSEYEGLSEYRRRHTTLPTASLSRIFGIVEGNYVQIGQFFKSETREQCFNVEKKLFNHTADAAVLYNVPRDNSEPVAHEAVKWVAYKSFSMRFRMDTCQYESTGTAIDTCGRSFAYRVVIPITVPEVPDLYETEKRTVRIASKSVMIMMPFAHDPNYTELFISARNDFKCNHVPRKLHRRYLVNLHNISSLATGCQGPKYTLQRNKWVVAKAPNDCGVCARSFSLLRHKHRCYMCNDAVCRKCVLKTDEVQVKSVGRRRGDTTRAKVCKPCVKRLRSELETPFDTPVLGDARRAEWKTVAPPHHLRMSETMIEDTQLLTSFTLANSYRERKSSEPEWFSTPTAKPKKKRDRFGTDQTVSTESSSFASSRSELGYLTSSDNFTIFGDGENIADDDDDIEDSDIIYEEECTLDQSSSSVAFTIDTSDMQRVRGCSKANDSFLQTSSSASTSPTAFTTISSSLYEQEILLRQIQQASTTHRGHRNP